MSHWEYGIQYPKCSIETKSAQRRSVDISALFSNIIQKRNSLGTHYVLVINGNPGFHSVDLDRVQNYMNEFIVE